MGGHPKFFFPWKHGDQPLNLRPHNFQTSSHGDSTTPQKSHGYHFLKLQFRGSNFLANPCGSSKLVCSSPLLVDSTVKPGFLHFLATSLKTGNLNEFEHALTEASFSYKRNGDFLKVYGFNSNWINYDSTGLIPS